MEEPLEIRLGGRRFTATMRTPNTGPNSDRELALGLLLSEGVIAQMDDVEEVRVRTHCRERTGELVNIVDVTLHDSSHIPPALWERSLISNASCGLCGKSTIEAMTARVPSLPDGDPLPLQVLGGLGEALRHSQPLFERTGGLHGAGLFDSGGRLLAAREDIGRHNATDKMLGFALERGWLPHERAEPLVLLVSGRVSFEIVQKALVARLPIVAGVSAASSLAVDLARAHNQTLIGWLRGERATVYCHPQRLALSARDKNAAPST
jgi:FdhD protein